MMVKFKFAFLKLFGTNWDKKLGSLPSRYLRSRSRVVSLRTRSDDRAKR
jgi:hypothetical protein